MVLAPDKQSNVRLLAESRIRPGNPFTQFIRKDIEQPISRRFEQIVDHDPARIAVKVGDQTVTYGTLNNMANRLAHALRSVDGVSNESVALLVKNDVGTIAAILGITKAGKIFVPLDVSFSSAWAKFILQDTNTHIVLAGTDGLGLAKSWLTSTQILIDFESLDAGWSGTNPETSTSADSLSQILYTSGTTGHPKGVMDNHRNMLHYVMRLGNVMHISPQDRMTLVRPASSAGALSNLYLALLTGATILPVDLKRGRNYGVRLLRLNYLVQPLDLPSGRIICLHPIAQPCEQGRECRYVSAKIGRHIA